MYRSSCDQNMECNTKDIALSVGEAAYYGLVKGTAMGKGSVSILGDMGLKFNLQVCTDSATAKGIASRKGLGKVRHIEVCQLWIQQEVANKNIHIVKVKGPNNLSDILTKYVDSQTLKKHMYHMYMKATKDRHELNPEVAEDESRQDTQRTAPPTK